MSAVGTMAAFAATAIMASCVTLNGVSFPKLGGDFRSARMNARGMNARESGN